MQGQALILAIPEIAGANEDTFGAVVRGKGPLLLRVAYRMTGSRADAEDIVQEAFLRLHRRGIGSLDGPGLNAWIYRVVMNLCIDRARGLRPEDELPELAHSARSAEANLLVEEQKKHLQKALVLLPPKERAAVVLREIEELPTSEVAQILGTTEVTVRSQVSIGIGKLRRILAKEGL